MRELVAFVVLLAATLSSAQTPAKADAAAAGKKTTEINFEDDTVEGDLTRPDGEFIQTRKAAKQTRLVKIREEFHDKVMQSVSEL